mmetsp:Transcript_12816/g.27704  ORF Transcript_12816/g.27704 Transcript_12816/m.27704 type:complete len:101 (+) Transcript_12816:974-1276(+)
MEVDVEREFKILVRHSSRVEEEGTSSPRRGEEDEKEGTQRRYVLELSSLTRTCLGTMGAAGSIMELPPAHTHRGGADVSTVLLGYSYGSSTTGGRSRSLL